MDICLFFSLKNQKTFALCINGFTIAFVFFLIEDETFHKWRLDACTCVIYESNNITLCQKHSMIDSYCFSLCFDESIRLSNLMQNCVIQLFHPIRSLTLSFERCHCYQCRHQQLTNTCAEPWNLLPTKNGHVEQRR